MSDASLDITDTHFDNLFLFKTSADNINEISTSNTTYSVDKTKWNNITETQVKLSICQSGIVDDGDLVDIGGISASNTQRKIQHDYVRFLVI